MELREYQKRSIKEIIEIADRTKKEDGFIRIAYQSPTGSGKTLTSLSAVLKLAKLYNFKRIVWTSYQKQIARQPENQLIKHFGATLQGDAYVVDGVSIEFTTWQSLRKRKPGSFDFLVLDEAHQGGSGVLSDHKSFKTILKRGFVTTGHLYVSATLFGVDPDLFPKMTGQSPSNNRTIFLPKYKTLVTKNEVRQAGFICDVRIISVQTEDTIEVKRNGKVVEYHNEDQIKLNGELQDNEISSLNVESRKNWNKGIARTMINLYLQREIVGKKSIPPTIFFCPPLTEATETIYCNSIKSDLVKGLNSVSKKFSDLNDTIKIVTGREFSSEVAMKSLNLFRKNKKAKILIVVGMAREGFDCPELEVGVDLKPSFSNERLMIQKIGRVSRECVESGKQNARYYYPNTIKNCFHNKSLSVENQQELNAGMGRLELDSEDDYEAVEDAVKHFAMLNQNEETADGTDVNVSVNDSELDDYLLPVSEHKKNKQKITTVEVDYIISKVDVKDRNNIKFTCVNSDNLINKTRQHSIEIKLKILETLNNLTGSGLSITRSFLLNNTPIGQYVYLYTNKLSNRYDEEFAQQLKAIRPDWFICKDTKRKVVCVETGKFFDSTLDAALHVHGRKSSRITNAIRIGCKSGGFTWKYVE